jgi:hypothetical protein
MNTVETNSPECMTLSKSNRTIISFEGSIIVCHPLNRQLSETTLDTCFLSDEVEFDDDNDTDFDNCIDIDVYTPSIIYCTTSKVDNGMSKSRTGSIDSMSHYQPLTLHHHSSSISSTSCTDKTSSVTCFTKIFSKMDTEKLDCSPKMPTRVKTIIDLQNLLTTETCSN